MAKAEPATFCRKAVRDKRAYSRTSIRESLQAESAVEAPERQLPSINIQKTRRSILPSLHPPHALPTPRCILLTWAETSYQHAYFIINPCDIRLGLRIATSRLVGRPLTIA